LRQEAQTGELGEHNQGPTGELEEAYPSSSKGEEEVGALGPLVPEQPYLFPGTLGQIEASAATSAEESVSSIARERQTSARSG